MEEWIKSTVRSVSFEKSCLEKRSLSFPYQSELEIVISEKYLNGFQDEILFNNRINFILKIIKTIKFRMHSETTTALFWIIISVWRLIIQILVILWKNKFALYDGRLY
jgi:hypothetical protein